MSAKENIIKSDAIIYSCDKNSQKQSMKELFYDLSDRDVKSISLIKSSIPWREFVYMYSLPENNKPK